HAFGDFERDVADEAVADDHVATAVVEIAAFDVADEVDRQLLEQREHFFRQLVALALFFADGEQADAGLRLLEDATVIDVAHDGELGEIGRFAVDVGADVDDDGGGTVRSRKDAGERRTIDTGERTEDDLGGGHACAGVAGGNEAGGFAVTDEAQTDAHR